MRPKRYCVAENRKFTAVRTTELDALEAQVERLVDALREAQRCLKEAKRRWAASTTNSDADMAIKDIDALLRDYDTPKETQ